METTITTTAPGDPKSSSGVYVYCIIECSEPRSFGKIGIGGRGDEVYTVIYRDLAAVVSQAALQVYDPTRENALTHEHVNEVVMIDNGFTPVPMSFGTLFKTEEDTIEFLKDTYDALRDVLQKRKDKLEVGHKVNGDKMIMNAAFLVARERSTLFDEKVREIGMQYEGKLTFKYTGPWPPYNFVTIRLQLERSAGV